MYLRILSVFALLIVSKFALAQIVNLETVSFSFVPKENGVILLNHNQPTTMRASFTVSRILSGASGTWPNLPIKAEIVLFILSDVPNTIIDVINVSTSDWYGPTHTISKTIEKDIVIPAGAVTIAKPLTSIVARWRFYKEGYPSPYNTDGWTDYVDKKYTSMKLNPNTILITSFSGPDAVCSEGIYTITNPYTISLENAAGIASLTSLGNNQWKVSKIGNTDGKVILRSNYNGKTFDKEIEIGSIAKGVISGNTSLPLGESRTYTLALNGNTDYKWSVSYNPNVTWTKLSPTSIKLSTTGSVPQGWSENITISAQAISSCGLSSNYITKTIKFVNDRDPRLED